MSRSGRPRKIQALLVTAVMGFALTALPARAGSLVNTSYSSGWVTNTILFGAMDNGQQLKPPTLPDPNDPPYSYSNGQIRFLLTRWSSVCTEPSNAPTVTVTDADGNVVVGVVTVEQVPSSPLFKVVRWTVNDSAYPHGLAAGRADETGGGAPYQAIVRVHFLKVDGTCNTETEGVAGPTYIGIDRRLPSIPTVTAPTSVTTVPRTIGCARPPCQPIQVPRPLTGPVVVRGSASDPTTRPFNDTNPALSALETSGVKAVIVNLYRYKPPTDQETLETLGTAEFVRSFMWLNPDCDRPYPVLAGGVSSGITACSSEVADWSVDVTASLESGQTYGVAAYAIDLAGYRSPVPPTHAVLPDNTNSGASSPKAFTFIV